MILKHQTFLVLCSTDKNLSDRRIIVNIEQISSIFVDPFGETRLTLHNGAAYSVTETVDQVLEVMGAVRDEAQAPGR